ncbi:MAG: hypothetical protein JEZ06_23245 [Anaerolineaceae bacterium]|nr:hypothetical protein [Anaerolineaceae bacterium]
MPRGKVMIFCVILFVGLFSACSRESKVCKTDPPNLPIETRQSLDISENSVFPREILIRNKKVMVDQIVHGPICDEDWAGIVYVDCDVEVPEWDKEGKPTFFDDCDLSIAPNTTVYVAFHKEEAYYKGCSCHYTE